MQNKKNVVARFIAPGSINRTATKLVLTLFLLIFTACSGTSLVDQALNLNQSEVGPVQVMAVQHLHDDSAGEHTAEETKIMVNDLGYEIEISEALIHFHKLHMISEGDDPTCIAGFDQEVNLHATHDLLSEDLVAYLLGTQTIPKLNFCQYELEIGGEADHHAVKFNHPTEEPIVGEAGGTEEIPGAFRLMGHWSNESTSGDFEFIGKEGLVIAGVFKIIENEEVIEHPLHFHEGEDILNVVFGTKYDLLFDGVDFESQSEEDQLHQIYENLEMAVHQHTGEVYGTGDGGDHDH